ncbi:MAG: AlpA family phage regulatory protein [Acidobacteriota bacterium]|nr:AlpA family phage regulatory protein [Acidobacteriota bacterium]
MQRLHTETNRILRRRPVQDETGYSRSTLYARVAAGLFTKPLKLGARAVGWPAAEVAEINRARIAGLTDDDIKQLVKRLEAERQPAISQEASA